MLFGVFFFSLANLVLFICWYVHSRSPSTHRDAERHVAAEVSKNSVSTSPSHSSRSPQVQPKKVRHPTQASGRDARDEVPEKGQLCFFCSTSPLLCSLKVLKNGIAVDAFFLALLSRSLCAF